MKNANRIKEAREAAGMSQSELARKLGTTNQQISRLELGQRKLTIDWVMKIAEALNIPTNALYDRPTMETISREKLLQPLGPDPDREKYADTATDAPKIPEIDIRAGMGGGAEPLVAFKPNGNGHHISTDAIKAEWLIPKEYMITELRVAPRNARVIEVQGDSMEPTLRSGDRVIVNTADKKPSPPGVFALWDGFGVVVKRIEVIPNSEPPTVRVVSDNAHHSTYERTVDEINIIGRIVWYARKL
ncbi:XRE family transcriptional regulator [Thalassospira xiamenensis]|jgi:phage repressor protein C with HTH and peptisase S24 domain|uniref:XRE family transcriptional regulator n=1 Tax=Thalassospira xiamenensis TaxID=220697 RepID=UPI00241F25D1|nr:helix-turn-helix domain-containing protein [Thalassospira xiamenensis]|tara:strand:- start:847 stop:1581 length:735 start_codon:yes stop_codon:yes gene_type:complete